MPDQLTRLLAPQKKLYISVECTSAFMLSLHYFFLKKKSVLILDGFAAVRSSLHRCARVVTPLSSSTPEAKATLTNHIHNHHHHHPSEHRVLRCAHMCARAHMIAHLIGHSSIKRCALDVMSVEQAKDVPEQKAPTRSFQCDRILLHFTCTDLLRSSSTI